MIKKSIGMVKEKRMGMTKEGGNTALVSLVKKFSLVLLLVLLSIGCSRTSAPPKETPEAVVTKFYEFTGTGGTRAISEAYRLTNAKDVRLTEDRFRDIVKRYPEGMKVKALKSDIEKDVAKVTIEMILPSSFGEYKTETYVYLKLDRETNNWKIDFTGELDKEDLPPQKG
ncbi:MAG: hypothetical protein WA240_07730 [Nitrospirota bacterium]